MFRKYFKGSFIFTIVAIILGFFLGAGIHMNVFGGLQAIFIILILGVLETSLSFDNAVINATVLKNMSPRRQKRFLTRGMVIAVFGMRILFPLIIVAIVGHINPIQTLNLAILNPNLYAQILTSSHIVIAGFGGAFLLMVALSFFLDIEKENHRIGPIERFLKKIGEVKSVETVLTLVVLLGIARSLPYNEIVQFLISGFRGIITYILVDGIAEILNRKRVVAQNVVKIGLSLFLYLEVLDASFSFDGVIGAFALSKNIIIIALGLGIGAMFVRSLTIMLVKKGTLNKYIYLEHGAFWAILALAVIMFINTLHHVPEVITGCVGAGFIGIALISSIRANKKVKHRELTPTELR